MSNNAFSSAAPHGYNGPERRRAAPLRERLFAAILDEIDYGVLLMQDESTVAHVNHVARSELPNDHPIELHGDQLRVRDRCDAVPLRAAIESAIRRGVRSMVTVGGEGAGRVSVAVVPLLPEDDESPAAALLMFAKRRVCQSLSMHAFARSNRLTPSETAVLQGLCEGRRTHDIARTQGVAMTTLRSQIGSIRSKTGAPSIVALMGQVAVLPPLVGALRRDVRAFAPRH